MTGDAVFSEEIVECGVHLHQSSIPCLKSHAVTHARASLPLIRSIIVVLVNPSIRLANLPKTAYVVNVSKKEKGEKGYWALLGMSQPKHRIIKPAASLANYKLHSHAHSLTNPLWEGEAEMWNVSIQEIAQC